MIAYKETLICMENKIFPTIFSNLLLYLSENTTLRDIECLNFSLIVKERFFKSMKSYKKNLLIYNK